MRELKTRYKLLIALLVWVFIPDLIVASIWGSRLGLLVLLGYGIILGLACLVIELIATVFWIMGV